MKLKGMIDVLAVVWFLLCSYLAALGFIFGSMFVGSTAALLPIVAVFPAVVWIGWRIYKREGYFVEPTEKQTIFLGGLIGILVISQYLNVADALSNLF